MGHKQSRAIWSEKVIQISISENKRFQEVLQRDISYYPILQNLQVCNSSYIFRDILKHSNRVRNGTIMGAKKSKLSDKAVKELADKTKCKFIYHESLLKCMSLPPLLSNGYFLPSMLLNETPSQ